MALGPGSCAVSWQQIHGQYGTVGILYDILAAAVLWIAAAGLRERRRVAASKAEAPPWQTFLDTLKNRPFVRLIGAYLLANTAFAPIRCWCTL